MGLNKTVPTNFGVDAKYWRLVTYAFDHANEKVVCVMCGYVDKAARDADKTPVTNTQLEITGDEFNGIDENSGARGQLYPLIKSNPFFSGATDVYEEGQP